MTIECVCTFYAFDKMILYYKLPIIPTSSFRVKTFLSVKLQFPRGLSNSQVFDISNCGITSLNTAQSLNISWGYSSIPCRWGPDPWQLRNHNKFFKAVITRHSSVFRSYEYFRFNTSRYSSYDDNDYSILQRYNIPCALMKYEVDNF